MTTDSTTGRTPDGPTGAPVPSGRRRRRRVPRTVLIIVLAIVIGGVGSIIWIRGSARPVDVDDVATPTGSTLPPKKTELRPQQGVYTYVGNGTDALNKPPRTQGQGPEIPATVVHDPDGCWTFRVDYSTNHWQTWDYCPRDGGLDEAGGMTFQRWDFGVYVNESTSTFTCEDAPTIRADQQPGDEWTQTCSGTTTGTEGVTISSGPYRYIGEETLEIGGQQVAAHRYHRERTTSGNQSGSESSDVWFSVETGMPLRNERSLEAHTNTIIGDVVYTEEGIFELTDLVPRPPDGPGG